MLARFINHFKKIYYFKKAAIFLQPGVYYINGINFYSKQKHFGSVPFWNTVRIRNRCFVSKKYNSGKFVLGKYKAKFVFDDCFVFLLYDKKRFYQTKKAFITFTQEKYFKTAKYNFIDKKMIITTDYIVGDIFNDDMHFNLFLDHICGQYTKKRINSFRSVGVFENVPFFIQHGDCKNSNIIWHNNNPIMIDLEAADSYPIFYDLFYYLFITKKQESIKQFKNISLRINTVVSTLGIKIPGIPLDYFLSCYLQFLNRYVSKRYSPFVVKFYLGWITYHDYSFLPLLNNSIHDTKQKIKDLGYEF